MRSRYPLLAASVFAIVLAGCDAADMPAGISATAVTVDARKAVSGDVLYALEPLDLDESFDVAVDAGEDELRLRSTRTAGGYALAFVPGAARPDSVVVTYLSHGEVVSAPVTYLGDEPVLAGTALAEPDSWHYVWQNGSWIIAKDYKSGGDNLTGTTTEFTTPSGEVVEVSDVAFTVYGLDAPPPTRVRFETPRDLRLTSKAFGRALR